MPGKLAAFDRFNNRLAQWANPVAMVALAVLVGVAVVDMLGNKFFSHPLTGSNDICGLLGAVITAFAFARTQLLGRHIRVDFFIVRLNQVSQEILEILNGVFKVGLVGTIIMVMFRYSLQLQNSGVGSFTLKIPLFPFGYAIILGFIPVFFIHLGELFQAIVKVRHK